MTIRGTLLDRESESAVYNDITGLLNERYDLLNELLSAWDSTVDSRDSLSVNLPDGRETVMYRVKVADSWDYYEQKAEDIYDDIYIQEVLPPATWESYMTKWTENCIAWKRMVSHGALMKTPSKYGSRIGVTVI